MIVIEIPSSVSSERVAFCVPSARSARIKSNPKGRTEILPINIAEETAGYLGQDERTVFTGVSVSIYDVPVVLLNLLLDNNPVRTRLMPARI